MNPHTPIPSLSPAEVSVPALASAPKQFGRVAQVERRETTYTVSLSGLLRSGKSATSQRLEQRHVSLITIEHRVNSAATVDPAVAVTLSISPAD